MLRGRSHLALLVLTFILGPGVLARAQPRLLDDFSDTSG
jgi:hypothetical protein